MSKPRVFLLFLLTLLFAQLFAFDALAKKKHKNKKSKPKVTVISGVVSESENIKFEFVGESKTKRNFQLRLVQSDRVLDSFRITLSRSERFVFNDDIYCTHQRAQSKESVIAIVANKNITHEGAFAPVRAWFADVQQKRFVSVNPSTVECELNKN